MSCAVATSFSFASTLQTASAPTGADATAASSAGGFSQAVGAVLAGPPSPAATSPTVLPLAGAAAPIVFLSLEAAGPALAETAKPSELSPAEPAGSVSADITAPKNPGAQIVAPPPAIVIEPVGDQPQGLALPTEPSSPTTGADPVASPAKSGKPKPARPDAPAAEGAVPLTPAIAETLPVAVGAMNAPAIARPSVTAPETASTGAKPRENDTPAVPSDSKGPLLPADGAFPVVVPIVPGAPAPVTVAMSTAAAPATQLGSRLTKGAVAGTAAPGPATPTGASADAASPQDARPESRFETFAADAASSQPGDTIVQPVMGETAAFDNLSTTPDAQAGLPTPAVVHNAKGITEASIPAAAAVPAPAPQPAIAARTGQIGHELGVAIARRISAGGDELVVRLVPAELGRIEVHMRFDERGGLRAVIAADSPVVLDMLRRDSADLSRSLSDAGVRSDGQSLRFRTDSGSSGSPNQQRSPWLDADAKAGRTAQAGFPVDSEPVPYQAFRTSGRYDLMA